jgi:hypothetical protein
VAVTVTGPRDGSTDARDGSTGTLAEEALRLIETLSVLAGAHACGDAHPGEGTSSSAKAGSSWGEVGAAAECRVCPVCRLIAAVRQLRPEVLAHLAAAGEELLAAAREFAASTGPAGPPSSSASAPAPEPSSGPGSSSGLPTGSQPRVRPPVRQPERIELD